MTPDNDEPLWPRWVAYNLRGLMRRYNAVYAAPTRPARFGFFRRHEHFFNVGPRR